jgi:hypothetical protein
VRKKLTVLVATAFMLAMMLASAGMDLKRRRRSVARPRGLLLKSARTHNARYGSKTVLPSGVGGHYPVHHIRK